MSASFLNLLIRWAVLALGVAIATRVITGISCDDGLTLFWVVLALSFLNAVLRPFLLLFTLPFILITAGIGVIFINALIFYFVGKLVDGFHVAGFWPALGGSLVVSFTSFVSSLFIRSSTRRVPPQPRPPSGPQAGGGNAGGDVIDI